MLATYAVPVRHSARPARIPCPAGACHAGGPAARCRSHRPVESAMTRHGRTLNLTTPIAFMLLAAAPVGAAGRRDAAPQATPRGAPDTAAAAQAGTSAVQCPRSRGCAARDGGIQRHAVPVLQGLRAADLSAAEARVHRHRKVALRGGQLPAAHARLRLSGRNCGALAGEQGKFGSSATPCSRTRRNLPRIPTMRWPGSSAWT